MELLTSTKIRAFPKRNYRSDSSIRGLKKWQIRIIRIAVGANIYSTLVLIMESLFSDPNSNSYELIKWCLNTFKYFFQV